MSNYIDNLSLALLSLQKELRTFLDDSGWKETTIVISGDPNYRDKEIVIKVTNQITQVGVPIVTIDAGSIRNEIGELGDEHGRDFVTISFVVIGADVNQLRTLANLIRRKLNDLTFTIYDFRNPKAVSVGTGLISNVVLDDISNWDSSNIGEKHVHLLNTTLELTAENLI